MATPGPWQKVKGEQGDYWWNTETDQTVWSDPANGAPPTTTSSAAGTPPNNNNSGAAKTSPPGAPPASPVFAPSGGRPSVGGALKDNASRIRRMFNKDTPGEVDAEVSSSAKPRKNTPPPASAASAAAAAAAPAAVSALDKAALAWQARRKQSFAAVFGPPTPMVDSIDAHVQNTARETKKDVTEVIQNLTISKPFEIEHKVRVRFDEDNIRFSGLPEDWSKEAHKQFGVPLHACPRVEVAGYADRIPLVLVKLKQRFVELDGYSTEGVFRLAPDGEDCAEVRTALNGGMALKSLQTAKDPHVVANLIKQFFRELKPKILCSWSKDHVMELAAITTDDVGRAGDLVRDLPEPQKSTFLWLLDLLADVASKSAVNKMTWTNLAIVLSPNLYDAQDVSAMEELILSQKVAQCTCVCLKWRIQSRMGT